MFKFKLQPVLRYREWIEEEKQFVFAHKQRIYEEEKEKARKFRELRVQYLDALREESQRDEVSMPFVNFYTSYIFFLEKKIVEQDEAVEKAKLELAKAHAELIESRKQKEIMGKLKEKAQHAWQEEEARVEQLGLDDFSTVKYIRTKKGLNRFAS